MLGFDVIETFFPTGSVTGNFRLGFLYIDPNISSGSDALLTRDGSASGGPMTILIGDPSITAIPTLMHGGLLLLALMLGGLAAAALRRYKK